MSGTESGISGWETYYLFIFAALLSLLVPLALFLISQLFGRFLRNQGNQDADKRSAFLYQSSQAVLRKAQSTGPSPDLNLEESDAGDLSAASQRNEVFKSDREISSLRVNTRFFLGVNVGLLLITAGLLLIPCIELFQVIGSSSSTGAVFEQRLKVAVSIVVVSLLAGLSLLYALKKGDLNWVRSFRENDTEDPEGSQMEAR